MKLLSTLVAALFSIVTYSAIAADAPKVDATPAAATAPTTDAAAKPAKKAHHHKAKKAVAAPATDAPAK